MLQIRLLGSMEVSCDGTAVPVAGGRTGSLLAILALAAGRSVGTEVLAERCWGESAPADPRASLHTAVRRLRRLIGNSAIATTPQGYALQVAPEQVDAVAFARLLDPVSEAAQEQIDAALQLWRGEPFSGDFSDWLLQTERTRLIQLRLSAIERHADLALAEGRSAAVVSRLQNLVARYPLRESLWARLLLALSACGRTAEALEQYAVIRGRIADELGVEPGVELRRIFEQLLAGEAPGLTDPDRPAGSAAALPVPQQLPLDVRHFLGRGDELQRLQRLLADPADGPTVIASITGPAGAGKTALAVHWAHGARAHFPDGQLYVDLRGFGPGEPTRTEATLEMFLHALNIPAAKIPQDGQGRTALLRSTLTGRKILLVLDNARDAEQIRPLLPGTGGRVLVTSRSQLPGLLARDGAVRIELTGLNTAQAVDLLAGGAGRSVTAEINTARALIALCGHLPLPLRVIAERLGSDRELTLAEVLRELRDEQIGLDAFPDQDQASDLRAVFSWSYQALPADSARMFRLLGTYPGQEIGTDAAAALAGIDARQARRLLDRLTGVSLLQQPSRGRYRFHDLIGTYATELSEQDRAETGAARQRLQQWCLHAALDAEKAAPAALVPQARLPRPEGIALPEFHDDVARVEWFDREQPTLLAVVDQAVAAGEDDFVCALGRPLVRLLWSRHRWTDQIALASTLRTAGRRAGRTTAEFLAIQALANAASDTSAHAQAYRWHPELLDAARRTGNPEYEMLALASIGVDRAQAGDFAEAVEPLTAALAISVERCLPLSTARYQCYLAYVHTHLGRHEEALVLAGEALEVQRNLPERDGIVDTLSTLGDTLAAMGRTDEAITRYEESLAAIGPHGNEQARAKTLVTLGDALCETRSRDEALHRWQQALEILTRLGHPEAAVLTRRIAGHQAEFDPADSHK